MLKIGNYVSLGEVIGRGSFGQVYHGMHKKTKEGVAIKEMDVLLLQRKSPKLILHLQNEINIMKEMKHENIVCLLECKTTKKNNLVYLVLEYCALGDLQSFLNKQPFNKLSEEMTKYFMIQLASGLQYLRNRDVIHRDLKPENLLLSVGVDKSHPILKIADFGFARHIESHNLAETLCGSPLHMAPEILSNQPYTVKSDLWSVGTIMYQMLFGAPLFQCNNFAQLFQAAKFQPIIIPNTIDGITHDLLTGLLQRDPNLRFSWDEFFSHSYFGGSLLRSPQHHEKIPLSIIPNGSEKFLMNHLPQEHDIPPPCDSLLFSVSDLPPEERDNLEYHNHNHNHNNVHNKNNNQLKNNHDNNGVPEENKNQVMDGFVVVDRYSAKEFSQRELEIKERIAQCESLGLLAKDFSQKGEEGKSLSLYYKSLQILQVVWRNLVDLIQSDFAEASLSSLFQTLESIKELYREYLLLIEKLPPSTRPMGIFESLVYDSAVAYAYRAYVEEVSSKNFGLSLELYKFSSRLLSILSSEYGERIPMIDTYAKAVQSRIDYLQI